MDIQELWDRARRQTEIIRLRMQELATFEATRVPYIFLAESSLNDGDTVIRKGHVVIERPSIILPSFSAQFSGFIFDQASHLTDETLATFLLVRGVQFPSLKYRHETSSLDLIEHSLRETVGTFQRELTIAEDIQTGLLLGPEDGWQFSVLLLVGALVIRSADGDLRRLIEAWRKRQGMANN